MRLLQRFDASYYEFQTLLGRVLLCWGSLSIALGAAAQASRDPFVKQVGLQALAWGAIDAVLAFFGLRGARQKQAERADPVAEARRFRLIVLANALLDLGYIAGGLTLVRGAKGRPERAGMGVGIIIQGAFLLLFDVALTLLSGQWTRAKQN